CQQIADSLVCKSKHAAIVVIATMRVAITPGSGAGNWGVAPGNRIEIAARALPSRVASAAQKWHQREEQHDCRWLGHVCYVGPGEAVVLDVDITHGVEPFARPHNAKRVLARGWD